MAKGLITVLLLIYLPPSHFWHYQKEVDDIFGRLLRNFLSSTTAFAVSFFVSTYILQKVKSTKRDFSLFKRVFRALLISELFDSSIFCILAYSGLWPFHHMVKFIMFSYITKVMYELIVFKHVTKPIIEYVKKVEKLDIVDTDTNFTIFSWEADYDERNNCYKE